MRWLLATSLVVAGLAFAAVARHESPPTPTVRSSQIPLPAADPVRRAAGATTPSLVAGPGLSSAPTVPATAARPPTVRGVRDGRYSFKKTEAGITGRSTRYIEHYETSRASSSEVRQHVTVAGATENGDRNIVWRPNGLFTTSQDGGDTSCDPHELLSYRFPLTPGTRWSVTWTCRYSDGSWIAIDATSVATGRDLVTIADTAVQVVTIDQRLVVRSGPEPSASDGTIDRRIGFAPELGLEAWSRTASPGQSTTTRELLDPQPK